MTSSLPRREASSLINPCSEIVFGDFNIHIHFEERGVPLSADKRFVVFSYR